MNISKKFLNSSFLIILFLNLSLIEKIKGDIPAECKFSEIQGKWEFFLSTDSFDPSLENVETTCGHGFPDKIEHIIGNKDKYPNNYKSNFILDLQKDHKVLEKGLTVGDWTPIYVQGFLLNYKNSILNTNFKYYLKSEDSQQFLTDCSKTLIGWYIPDKKNVHENWRCFYAKKINQNKFLKNIEKSYLEIKPNENHYQKKKEILFSTKYDELSGVIDKINNANLTWKAELNPKLMGKSLYEVKKSLGLNKGLNKIPEQEYEKYLEKKKELQKQVLKPVKTEQSIEKKENKIETVEQMSFTQIKIRKITENEEKDSDEVTDKKEVLKYINTKIEDIDEHKLPRNWDWRNVGGINFVPDPMEQGDCGSCYAIATIEALESRLRIKTFNEDKTEFSVQFPISCNFYGEGCDGGFPILVGKFFHEFEIIPKDCFKYKQKNGECAGYCNYKEKYDKKYVVSKYGYIGKYYTGTSEIDMMKELRARGPILGSLMVKHGLIHYRSGIFSDKPLVQNSDFISDNSPWDDKIEFVEEEHSILIVGYGEENGIKYWTCLNSWGKDFGENGYFRILRGENDSNIEGMAEFVNIDVYDRNTGKKLF